jgi:hypothetical protein
MHVLRGCAALQVLRNASDDWLRRHVVGLSSKKQLQDLDLLGILHECMASKSS